MIRAFLPSEIQLGVFTLHLYGILLAVSLLLVLIPLEKRFGQKLKMVDYLLFGLMTLIGARLFYIIAQWEETDNILQLLFTLKFAGLSIFGALCGAAVALWLITKIRKLKFNELIEIVLLYLPLAQTVGRWGNFFNNELYGKPLNASYALYIPPSKRLKGFETVESYHPLFLYESLLNLLSFLFLLLWLKKRKKAKYIPAFYFINYGLIRFLMNRFRLDLLTETSFLGLIKVSDLFAIILIGLGIGYLVRVKRENLVSTK